MCSAAIAAESPLTGRAAAWLREQGAMVVESIEDPDSGHGALMLNPKDAKRVLDLFLTEKR